MGEELKLDDMAAMLLESLKDRITDYEFVFENPEISGGKKGSRSIGFSWKMVITLDGDKRYTVSSGSNSWHEKGKLTFLLPKSAINLS